MRTLITLAVVLVVIAFITYRQTRWLPVKLSKLLRMPLIFVVAGLVQIPLARQQLPRDWHLSTLDLVLIAVELLLAVAVGWLMGRFTEIATIDGAVSSRLGKAGVAVWVGFIAVRISLGVLAGVLHTPLSSLPAVIFFVVAAIKITQAVVVRERLTHHDAESHSGQHQPVVPLADAGSRR